MSLSIHSTIGTRVELRRVWPLAAVLVIHFYSVLVVPKIGAGADLNSGSLVARAIDALPRDAESVLVLGPCRTRLDSRAAVYVSPPVPAGASAQPPPGPSFQSMVCEGMTSGFSDDARFAAICRDVELELSLSASRTYMHKAEVGGGTLAENVKIFVLRAPIPSTVRAAFDRASAHAEGFAVITKANEVSDDVATTMLYATPNDRVLIATNSGRWLVDVLKALSRPQKADNGLLPQREEILKGKPGVWAVRHYAPTFMADNPTNVLPWDPDAKRLIVSYNDASGTVTVRYESAGPAATATLQRLIDQWAGRKFVARQAGMGSAEVDMRASIGTLFSTSCLLGLVVYP